MKTVFRFDAGRNRRFDAVTGKKKTSNGSSIVCRRLLRRKSTSVRTNETAFRFGATENRLRSAAHERLAARRGTKKNGSRKKRTARKSRRRTTHVEAPGRRRCGRCCWPPTTPCRRRAGRSRRRRRRRRSRAAAPRAARPPSAPCRFDPPTKEIDGSRFSSLKQYENDLDSSFILFERERLSRSQRCFYFRASHFKSCGAIE